MTVTRRAALPLLSILLVVSAFSTARAADSRDDQLNRLLGLALRSPFMRQAAIRLIDRIGPRVAGTPNGSHAEELAAEIFREAGVPLVRQEAVNVPLWQVHRASLALVKPTNFSPPVVPLANSASTPPQGLLLRLVDAGYGTPQEIAALGDAARGAALLVRTGVPAGQQWLHRSQKYDAAAAAGAAAFLYTPAGLDRPPRSGTVTLSGAPGPIPALSIPATTGAWLARLAAAGAGPEVRVTLLADRIPATAYNIVADLPGRDSSEVVLACAHLDSWDQGQGAGDNGTGTIVLWQAARTLVEQGLRPRRTIRFVSFTGEELGLLGSGAYVRDHGAQLESIRAVVNLDMVGEPTGFATMLQPQAAPLLADLAEHLAGFGLATDVPDRPGLYSDHQPFLLAGVPVLVLRSQLPAAVGAAYHSARDTFDLLDLGQQQRAAAVTAALLWRLANADPLPTVRLDPKVVREELEAAGIEVRSVAGHPEAGH
ncbi:MAG: M20/M25/M40 family metallo-hydrolase [Acidobacteria bacterium]|nr:M20/M25/M40 family metallo-hydrolase [Acidobacteriota bacterium]